ncbi:MAG: VWA domain-containing protein [Paracoccaceae bacterium]|nr:VWA domain-containing protein [Paracoccaceae bacterium]
MTRFRLFAAALACALPFAAPAQERANTILVLDASGSMWGQIDGTAKITIAQDVVRDLLGSLPAEQQLGLTAYGHRTKGDCTDIETLVAPGTGTRDAIAQAVTGIQPRGKTPMTDAVVAAAQALRHTEEKATVILVSDGIETCNPDPCAAARALEEAGADFTAHVIGFDVADPAARAQMQCLAEETGGKFLTAANAAELGTALTEVTQAPEPVAVTLVATAGQNGPRIDTPLMWDLRQGDTMLVEFERGATLVQDLLPGDYTASVLRPEDEASAELAFTVGDSAQTVTLVLPNLLPEASVTGPDTAVAGATVPITWEGPDLKNDYIAVSEPGDRGYVNYVYTRNGSPGGLIMPPEPGTYELRYVMADGRQILATQTITVTPAEATLEAEASALAGAELPVTWTGPDYRNDYIAISEPGDRGYENYAYTRNGSPGSLTMPAVPGTYELRYVMAQDRTVLATKMIEVTAVTATLDAPEQATAGEELTVGWTGPDYRNDYLSVARPGDDRYENYTYTREGAPLDLTMPLTPGTYELRYIMAQDRTVLATKVIEVVEVGARLTTPETARAGARIVVDWDGPGYERDYVSVARVGDPRYEAYTYTRQGNPLLLQMPPLPGEYEVRYVAASGGESVLVRKPITLTEVSATLEAAESGPAGGNLAVHWEGPEYRDDYIAVSAVGASDSDYETYVYTREDSPTIIKLPEAPGAYELRYYMGKGKRVIARRPVTVE